MSNTMNSTEESRDDVLHLVREQLVEEVDDVIHGAAFDGRRVVLGAGNRLVRLAPDSGRVVDQFETFPQRGGLAYDGRHLWQHSGGRLQELDPRTGFVLRSLSPKLGEVAGLECTESDLLVLHSDGHAIARVETLDATTVVRAEFVPSLRGLAWVARELWSSIVSSIGAELVRLDFVAGRIVERFALPPGVLVSDLAGDAEGRIWSVDGRSRTVRVFKKGRPR